MGFISFIIWAMVFGGIGFAIGSFGGGGWAFFGAILGGFIGIAMYFESKKQA